MNRFLWYLIQNQYAINEKLEKNFNSNIASKFESKISLFDEFDEYSIAYFHNLDTTPIDSKSNEYKLEIKKGFVILTNKGYEINIPKSLYENIKNEITIFEDDHIEIEDLKKYNGANVRLFNDDDFPLVFMTEEQIELNLNYLTETLNEILEDLKLNAQASEMELKNIFKIHN